MAGRSGYWKNEGGSSAAEFALVVLPFVTLIMGVIGVSLMLYANHTLEYAAEAAARCASVDAAVGANCTTGASIRAYALSHYTGPGVAPVFVYSASGCGHIVTATATFPLNAGLINLSVPLSATACYP